MAWPDFPPRPFFYIAKIEKLAQFRQQAWICESPQRGGNGNRGLGVNSAWAAIQDPVFAFVWVL